jgi:C4-dicarboxylate-binding protein DctP
MTKLYTELGDRIQTSTEGKWTIHVALAGELGIEASQFIGALAENSIQASELASGHQAGTVPHLKIFSLPFFLTSQEDIIKVGEAVWPLSEQEFDKLGVKLIAEYAVPGVHLWTTKPVDDVSDLKGLKVRAWDEASANAIKAIGGVPVIMSASEAYEAMQRGVVEGGVTSSAAAISVSWHEVADYGYIMSLMFPWVYVGVSKTAFEELPENYQEMLLQEAEKMKLDARQRFNEADQGGNKGWIDAGNELIEPAAEQMMRVKGQVQPLWQQLVDQGGPTVKQAYDLARQSMGQ